LNQEKLLRESVEDKFMRYVKIETTSDEEASTVPSTQGQWQLLKLLDQEARAIGLRTNLTSQGVLYVDIPGGEGETLGFLAHVDTAPGISGKDVKPIVHRVYSGGTISLPNGSELSPETCPALKRVIGHDLITSDGSTLLGADDKAGVAALMAAACRWVYDTRRSRPKICLAFTPDEEIGRGVNGLETSEFNVARAYTIDGGELGEIEAENFNAVNLSVEFKGINIHTGNARGQMINALQMAAEFITGIPAGMRPETTDGTLGFIHPNVLKGGVEQAELQLLVRDFDTDAMENNLRWLKSTGKLLMEKYPGGKVNFHLKGSYRNMRETVEKDPRIVGLALQAMENLGITPMLRRIRGGTDGAALTEKGIPTPNLFAGGVNFHSRTEWLSIQWLRHSVEVILELGTLWSHER
jgi:tripeptide aminopeptidase